MGKIKKENWYVSLLYTVGVWCFSILFGSLGLLFLDFSLSDQSLWIGGLELLGFAIGIAVFSLYIRKNYDIQNLNSVVKISLLYHLLFWLIVFLLSFVDYKEGIQDIFSIDVIFFLSETIVFYLASKKFLQNNS